jgi:hypothetical protein
MTNTKEDSLAYQNVIPMSDPVVEVELPEGVVLIKKSQTPIRRYNAETGLFDLYHPKGV